MDFITTTAPDVPVTINGTAYKVPRFLFGEFKAWAAERQESIRKEALTQLQDSESRARFLLYHQPPPLDIAWIGSNFTSPDGAESLVRQQLTKANVPAADIDGLITNTDPILIRALADELRSGNGMIVGQMRASGDAGSATNPLTGQPPTSDGSPETTPTITPTGSEPTPAATPTA